MLKVFLSWLLAANGLGIAPFGSIPTQPKQTKMVLMPLPFQCVIKCVLWGEGVNKNYLEISDEKRQLPGYLIYMYTNSLKYMSNEKTLGCLGYIGCI